MSFTAGRGVSGENTLCQRLCREAWKDKIMVDENSKEYDFFAKVFSGGLNIYN